MQMGHSVIPLRVYIDKGLCKVEIALVKGKNNTINVKI